MLSAAEVQRVATDLIGTRNRLLRQRPISAVLEPLAAAVEQWLVADSPWRRQAERELPAATGFSPAMIRHGLPLMLEPLRGDAVACLLDRELGSRVTVDRTGGPPLILHVLSGNIPALAAAPLILSLAIKSAVMVKASHDDRVFPSLFIESLRAVDPQLAQCAAALYWPGGRLDLESAAFGAVDLVVASGRDATVADIKRRVPRRFIGHGHRISFAAVTREAIEDAGGVAKRLAYDTVLWDQQGCLSPQLAYIERGGPVAVERFAEILTQQLAQLATELPPRQLSLDEQAAIQRFRQEAEWRAARGEEVTVFASPGGVEWTVVYDAVPAFAPTPLNRTIWLKPIDALADLPPLLAPARPYLEAAGLAAPPDRRGELAALLTNAGVHRVCPLGVMQRPDLTWRPGGRPRVAEWV
jgi:hypothetical protein